MLKCIKSQVFRLILIYMPQPCYVHRCPWLQRNDQHTDAPDSKPPMISIKQLLNDSLNILLLAVQGIANGTAAEDSSSSNKRSSLGNTLLLAIPTMFDLTATVLMSIGLLFVTASVYQVC